MGDSKRQKIIDLVIARMEQITIENGYRTDLGETVGDWVTNWDEEDLPALSVCDTVEENLLAGDQPSAPTQTNKLPILFRIFNRSTDSPADIRKMIADVWQAIKVDPRWTDGDGNKLAMWTKPRQSGMVLSEEAFKLGGAMVEIEISYLTETFNPET